MHAELTKRNTIKPGSLRVEEAHFDHVEEGFWRKEELLLVPALGPDRRRRLGQRRQQSEGNRLRRRLQRELRERSGRRADGKRVRRIGIRRLERRVHRHQIPMHGHHEPRALRGGAVRPGGKADASALDCEQGGKRHDQEHAGGNRVRSGLCRSVRLRHTRCADGHARPGLEVRRLEWLVHRD